MDWQLSKIEREVSGAPSSYCPMNASGRNRHFYPILVMPTRSLDEYAPEYLP